MAAATGRSFLTTRTRRDAEGDDEGGEAGVDVAKAMIRNVLRLIEFSMMTAGSSRAQRRRNARSSIGEVSSRRVVFLPPFPYYLATGK
ncbi:hypothetical protein [Propionivibrio sp.]|uniref:hypothetical protein n=1 Tax=Propionivibrio sp. TaxID=2212460 RepID=UPI0025E7ADD1|nr:hypothetical protein [Propionivibrio sp.]